MSLVSVQAHATLPRHRQDRGPEWSHRLTKTMVHESRKANIKAHITAPCGHCRHSRVVGQQIGLTTEKIILITPEV